MSDPAAYFNVLNCIYNDRYINCEADFINVLFDEYKVVTYEQIAKYTRIVPQRDLNKFIDTFVKRGFISTFQLHFMSEPYYVIGL